MNHKCGERKKCNSCRQEAEDDHLCPLIKESCLNTFTKIAFIGMEHFDCSNQNCLNCFQLRQANSKDMFCDLHKNLTLENDSDPCLIVIYQVLKATLTKYVISCFGNEPVISKESNFLSFNYYFDNCNYETKTGKKRIRKSDDFKRNFAKLHEQKSFLLMDKFLQLITLEKWSDTTFICQDSDSLTYMAILRSFVKNGFCPVLVRNGRRILVLEIKSLNIRFITSNSYFEGNEYELANQYCLTYTQHFFPKQFLRPENFNYQGQVPEYNFFESIYDNSTNKINKKLFVQLFKNLNFKWNFQKELITYSEQKLLLLTLSCLKFLEDSYLFQLQLSNRCKNVNFVFLNPFSYPLCSLGGFVFKLFKLYYLNKENIFSVQNEYGISSKNVSKIEYEWASLMDYKYPEKEFLFAFNNKFGQKFFKEAVPDLYSPITKQAYFFNGCIFHGHFENCLINPDANENSKNPFGKSFKDLNEQFFKKMCNLLINNNEVEEVIIQWECIYRKERQTEYVKIFLEREFKIHPLIRLRPRSCVRGAFFDTYALRWSKKLFPEEKMYFIDVNGLYSFCAIKYKYMTGKYYVAIGKDINNISLINKQFCYKNTPIMGSMLVTIVPPKDLFFPFLLYRTKNGKTLNTLCSKCCETECKVCNHNDNDRAITACYMISEIEFALELNYKLISIHECHYYESFDYILKDFVQILNFFKTQNSDCLKFCKTKNDKINYCKFLNTEMDNQKPYFLTPSNISFNKPQRTFFKVMANALFGKLEQKNNQTKTLFVSNQSDLEAIFFSENQIDDIFCINENICQVQVSANELKLKPNRKSNCYIGAQVTAYARATIYSHIQTLLQNSAKIYRVDCDSIIFALEKTQKIPIILSEAVGHFKLEIEGEIESFYSLGPKNYSLTFKTKNDQYETICKVSGLSISNSLQKDILNDQLYEFYLSQFLKDQKESIFVTQQRTTGNFKKLKVSSHIENIVFSNNLSQRRFVSHSLNYVTFPFGYKTA